MFGRSKSSVTQQIVIYIFARVVLAAAKLSVQPPGPNVLVGSRYGDHGGMGVIKMSEETRELIRRRAWPVFASLSWASVMWLYEWYPDMLQPSLRSSMTYMYVYRLEARQMTDSLTDMEMLTIGTLCGTLSGTTNKGQRPSSLFDCHERKMLQSKSISVWARDQLMLSHIFPSTTVWILLAGRLTLNSRGLRWQREHPGV